MPIAHLDCQRGLDENSLLAAIVDAGIPLSALEPALRHCGFAPLELEVTTCPGWRAMRRTGAPAPDSLASETWRELESRIKTAPLAAAARDKAIAVLTQLAQATAKSRGVEPDLLRVSDLGGVDVLAPMLACVFAMSELQLEILSCSDVGLGTTDLHSPPGKSLYPAPLTVHLLHGAPLATWPGPSPRITPAGAILIQSLVTCFQPLPTMTITQTGYGMPWNHSSESEEVVRIYVGTPNREPAAAEALMIETNLDDCSPEIIGYTLERLLAAGAWDCYATPIQMKKSRPGIQLSVIAPPHLRATLEGILFTETTTLGVRVRYVERTTLPRRETTWTSPWGPIHLKLATLPSGQTRGAPEYEDCRRIALATGIPLTQIYDAARIAVNAGHGPSQETGSS